MNAKHWLLISVALLAGTAGIASYILMSPQEPETQQKRIDFQLTDLDGKLRQASEWDGQVVLVNFWAPWCAPCRAEIPILVDLQTRFGDQGFQVLGPALDDAEAVRRFAGEYGMNYPLFADINAVMDLQEAYGDTRLPYTVLLDRQGTVVYRHAGELEADTIEAQVRQQIRKE